MTNRYRCASAQLTTDGACTCARDGILRDGCWARVGRRLITDAAPAAQAGQALLADAASIADRAARPQYDSVRGGMIGTMPAAEYLAIYDAAREADPQTFAARDAAYCGASGAPAAQGVGDALASRGDAYAEMCSRQADAWRGTPAAPPAPRNAPATADVAALHEDAYAAMMARQRDAWRGAA